MNLVKVNNLKILLRLLLLSITIIVITIWIELTFTNPVEAPVMLNDKSLTYYLNYCKNCVKGYPVWIAI